MSRQVNPVKPMMDSSQIVLEIQMKLLYLAESTYSGIKSLLFALYSKSTSTLYNIYLNSFLFSIVFKFQTYFLNNSLRRKRLLEWLQTKLAAPFRPNNFNTDWKDGILLCALCEAMVPGSCPRYDVLNPNYPRNNIRLALNLIKVYLHINSNITETEILECKNEAKLVHLLSQIRVFYAKKVIQNTGSSLLKMGKSIASKSTKQINHYFSSMDDHFSKCHIKGMGTVSGVKGRRVRFSIYYLEKLPKCSLIFEIVGPNESFSSEKVMLRNGDEPLNDNKSHLASMNYDQIAQNLLMRAATKTQSNEKNLKIPFFYEFSTDHLMITYVPLFAGEHQISIIWQGRHVLNSPYTVSIEETEYLEQEVNDIGPKFIPGLQYPLCLLNSEKKFKIDDMGTVIRRKIVKETIVSNQKEYDYDTYFKSKFSQHFLKHTADSPTESKSPVPIIQTPDSPTNSLPALMQPKDVNSEQEEAKSVSTAPKKRQIYSIKTKTTIKRNVSLDQEKLTSNKDNEEMKIDKSPASKSVVDLQLSKLSPTLNVKEIFNKTNENFNEELEKLRKDLDEKLSRFRNKSTEV